MATASCGSCCGSGQRMVTVSRVGADGTPYQGVEMQTCGTCSGSGQITTSEDD
ncbi:hypothetical protein OG233_30760 (plasmid) [Streptomyces sp. NBC_01218]|uniref:hypothetical protein n=1 Tax=Streptomyces sp. NBC_01218 TaxID=2903780 RepID=UPI002E0E8EFF|nr:hypothetical protein OG233_30760 [Streptomyces sp. NBC_01218]